MSARMDDQCAAMALEREWRTLVRSFDPDLRQTAIDEERKQLEALEEAFRRPGAKPELRAANLIHVYEILIRKFSPTPQRNCA